MNQALLLLLLGSTLAAGEERRVLQLVYFDFLPGKTSDAIRIFRDEALPLYRANEPMLRFRAYREAESPESLDLVIASTFRGMAGMDASNAALREEAKRRGSSVGEIYGRIAELSAGHRDEFVEVDESLSWGDVEGAKLVVLVSIRLAPGKRDAFETILGEQVVPWERKLGALQGSGSGRYLVSSGFDFFRILALSSLGDWHAYRAAELRQPFWRVLDESIVSSRQILLAPVPELSVR